MIFAALLKTTRPTAGRITESGGSLANPPGWLVRLFGGEKTASGVVVDEDRALTFAAVYSAVMIYQNAVSVLPLVLHRRLEDGGKAPALDHPVYRLLHLRPNGEMPASRFWAWIEGCKLLWGNGYAEIERDRAGRPLALWPIHPSRVTVKRTHEGGPIIYEVSGSRTVTIDQRDMFHIMGYSRDGLVGQSVVGFARESMGLALASEQHGARFFGNSAQPGGVLQRPKEAGELTEGAIRRLRADWMEMVGGENVHCPAVLEEGTEWKPIGMPNKDSQFLETRQFQVLEVARWFTLPPHKLGHLSDATFSNIEHQQMEYVTESLMPQLVAIRDEAAFKLLSEDEEIAYKVEWNVRGMLRGDHAARASYYEALWRIGAYTINDILRLEDMNPIGPAGDVHFVQLNMTTAEKIAEELGKPAADQASEDLKAFKRDVVKAFLNDGTTNDVMFNLTRIRALLADVDLPVQPGYDEPWLPVRDDAGELVSGDTITDAAGDTVGGDVIGREDEDEAKADDESKDADAGEEAEGDASDEDGGEDEAGDETEETPQGRAERIGREMMPVVVAELERMARKAANAVSRAARKHAGDAAAFEAWLGQFVELHAAEVAEALGPPARAMARLCDPGSADLGEIDGWLTATSEVWCRLAQEEILDRFAAGTIAAWAERRWTSWPAEAASEVVEVCSAVGDETPAETVV